MSSPSESPQDHEEAAANTESSYSTNDGGGNFHLPPPSFSYNAPGAVASVQVPHFPSAVSAAPSMQHPFRPISFGTAAPMNLPPTAANFSFNGNMNMQLQHRDHPLKSDAPTSVGHASSTVSSTPPAPSSSETLPHHPPPLGPMLTPSTSPNLLPATSERPINPPFLMPPGLPGMPGPPIATLQRPGIPIPSPNLQQQIYPPYHRPPHGVWLPHQQMSLLPGRPPFPYPTAYPGPLPAPGHAALHPSGSFPDSRPPGVNLVGSAGPNLTSSSASGHPMLGTPAMQKVLLPPGIDHRNQLPDVKSKENAAVNESADAWTAHKTETGVVYYYNAITGVSTYEKPPGFKGEAERVPVQSTPVSMENLSGTDWALITTNDGKNYYYNNKTKLSSWQIPSEVVELRKKQEAEIAKENAAPHPTDMLTEKGPAPTVLSAPAVNTGGRDSIAPRASNATGASSALDLIKKKLQDSVAPATSSPSPISSGLVTSESNGPSVVEATAKGAVTEKNRDKSKDANGEGNASDSLSDSDDEENSATKDDSITQFKEMLKERGVAPFSKWEKELPKIIFDPRFKAIPSHAARRSLFEHYVKTRAEEERKEKRAAQKAAMEGFKQLLVEASEDIDHNTDYQTFRKKWGIDPRFEALDRKDREHLFNERVISLKKAALQKAQEERAAAVASFKSMLREKGDITADSRWSRVKESLRDDPRYNSVKLDDRIVLFNGYLSELKAAEEEAEREAKAKREEQEKLKERERELRKRKEREEQEMERVKLKVQRKEAVASFQALLVEMIKDPEVSWSDSKLKLEKDPQGRATNSDLDPSETEKLFREHIKMLYERCTHEYKALLAEAISAEAAAEKTVDGKTVLDSWSTAKRILKPDPRYNKMPRKDREFLWRRYAEDMLRKQKILAPDQKEDNKLAEPKVRSSNDSGKYVSGSRRIHDRS